MTRTQDGGANREEGLEGWSLGTLSEGPQPSAHAACVPSRSARVLLSLLHSMMTSRSLVSPLPRTSESLAQSLVSFLFYPQCAQCPVKSPISRAVTLLRTPKGELPLADS